MKLTISSDFANTVLRIFGDAGRIWLACLPNILARCASNWQLSQITPYPDLSINFVAQALLPDDEPVVLKIGVPHPEIFTEIAALQCYQGRRIVRCVDANPELPAMLLERLHPGDMLSTITDNAKATKIAAELIRNLPIPCPTPHHFPTFAEWMARAFQRYRDTYGDDGGALAGKLLADAERCLGVIQNSCMEDMLLHGDLHHLNILYDAQRGWTAIDPKGVIGPPCLEAGRFFSNQLPEKASLDETEAILAQRVEIISNVLGAPPELIWQSAFVDRVLSLCWSTEDNSIEGNWVHELAVTNLMQKHACGW